MLRKVLEDIPLSEDGIGPVSITCVEYWSRSASRQPLDEVLLTVYR